MDIMNNAIKIWMQLLDKKTIGNQKDIAKGS